MNTLEIILKVIGGTGIFLYGITLMGDSLKSLAGSKLKVIIEKTTNKVWKGILVGIALTALIQSSSGLTAILISLISAGLMTLPQAIPVIMGANIGTTVTAVLVGLNIKEYALAFVAIGAIAAFFVKNKKIHMLGLVVLGFGFLFLGLSIMDEGLMVVAQKEFFEKLMKALDRPALGVFTGIILTGIIQSSSALIAILQNIYATVGPSGAHSITLSAALAVILGSNIGTTVTSIIASTGGSKGAKRAALAHLIFNVFGTAFFLILFVPFRNLMQLCEDKIPYLHNAPANTLALAHIIFNVVTTFILSFFVKLLVKIVEKIIPLSDSEKLIQGIDQLEGSLIKKAPVLALENAKKIINDMGIIVSEMFYSSKKYISTNDHKLFDNIMKLEDVVDSYDQKLHDYLVKLSNANLDNGSIMEQAIYFDTIRDLERIADHAVNLAEFMDERYQGNYEFTHETTEMITHMLDLISDMIDDSLEALKNDDVKAARRVRATEPMIDELEKKYRKAEVDLITRGEIVNDLHFVDILANLERIGDHANNIADNILTKSQHELKLARIE